MTDSIEKIIGCLSRDPILEIRNKLGLCRIWTDRVLDLIDGMQIDKHELNVEAREAQIEPFLSHTFIRLKIGERSYLWDGTGVGKHEPYFGLEETAPDHLKHSDLDMINRIRNSG